MPISLILVLQYFTCLLLILIAQVTAGVLIYFQRDRVRIRRTEFHFQSCDLNRWVVHFFSVAPAICWPSPLFPVHSCDSFHLLLRWSWRRLQQAADTTHFSLQSVEKPEDIGLYLTQQEVNLSHWKFPEGFCATTIGFYSTSQRKETKSLVPITIFD